MSIEQKITELTAAVVALTKVMEASGAVASPAPAAPVIPPIVAADPAPSPASAPASAPAMPTVPTFEAPAAPVTTAVSVSQAPLPFSDGAGLTKYVVDLYKVMGPEKGAKIQQVMTDLGYSNVNDIKTEHYADFYAKVEALKAS